MLDTNGTNGRLLNPLVNFKRKYYEFLAKNNNSVYFVFILDFFYPVGKCVGVLCFILTEKRYDR